MKRCIVLLVLLLTGVSQTVEAGVLFARRPGTEAPLYNLTILHIRTSVKIVGQMAVTHVDEEFFNDNNLTLEGFYAFQLPPGAKVNRLWLWENGKRLIMVVKKKEEAYRLYDSVVIGTRRDPALLEELGANRFQLKVFPIPPNSSRRIEIQYFHTLPLTDDGSVNYHYPLNMLGYQAVPVATTSLQISVASKQTIEQLTTSFDSNPLLNRVTKNSDNSYSISFGLENQNYTQDYVLRYKPEGIFNIFPTLSFIDTADVVPDPYFITWHPLKENTLGSERDLTFVLDASGSMYGNRLTMVRSAVKNILTKLKSGDRFRIILFSSNALADPADGSFREVTQADIEAANLFIDRYYEAMGGTNYEAAFIAALNAQFRPNSDKRMLFLTDGEPTFGKTTYADLIKVIETNDQVGVRIYPVLFYTSNIQLLHDIALARGGKATTVDAGDDLETVIGRIMLDLMVGGFDGTKITYADAMTYHVYPKAFPPVVGLDQLITTGRAKALTSIDASIEYSNGGQQYSFTRPVDLVEGFVALPEVAAYWASKRIEDLLNEIKLFGETPELKQSIINLSIRYQVLSPYTAFLVLETNPIDPPSTLAELPNPADFTVSKLYPNPASLSVQVVSIDLEVRKAQPLRLVITDLLGRVVREMWIHPRIGNQSISWDFRDNDGNLVPAGTYMLRFTTNAHSHSRQLVVVR